MKVYHGSYKEIEIIDLTKCKPHKDFGRGFYVTNIRSQAEYWAKRMGRDHDTEGYVTEFTFYENAFNYWELRVLRFDSYTEEWLDFVVLNRNPTSPIPSHDYDLVEGPVADDDVTHRIIDYLREDLSKIDFLKELSYHKPTHQICFCTLKSLQMLERTDLKVVSKIEKINNILVETLLIEYDIEKTTATDLFYSSATYATLADKSTGLYGKPWQEIYEMLRQELKNQKTGDFLKPKHQ